MPGVLFGIDDIFVVEKVRKLCRRVINEAILLW